MRNSPAKGQNQKTPTPNTAQNDKSNDAATAAGLTDDQAQQLHDAISGQDKSYQEVLDIANQIASGTH
jgi:hypothetical protein